MSENIFEKANRLKLRFEHKGQLSAEDLWDLTLEELSNMYSKIKKEVRNSEDSLLTSRKTKAEKEAELKLEIVKYVFDEKQVEAEEEKVKSENKRKKEYLKGVLERKQNEAIESKSQEEILAMLEELA